MSSSRTVSSTSSTPSSCPTKCFLRQSFKAPHHEAPLFLIKRNAPLALPFATRYNRPNMRHTFHSEQWLPYPVDRVFAFFANPENLPRLMPAWQKARIEEATFAPPPPQPASASTSHIGIAAGTGTQLKISFRPFPYSPVRILWNAEISDFVWNDHFCDQQLRGPFAYWHHCHHVQLQTRTDDSGARVSGTLLHDEVEYELPFGKLGDIANRIITHQLHKTFAYRHTRTLELLMPTSIS
jgi:ligand-binding SRPBCC domain-containing protein